jgi:hypothetical protein
MDMILLIGAPAHVYPSWHQLRLPHKYFVEKIARLRQAILTCGLRRMATRTHPYQYGKMLLMVVLENP